MITPKLDGFTREIIYMINVIRCDVYLSIFYKQLIPLLAEVCKLLSCGSKPTYALLASKRRPIDLQKMLFKTLTNALLKSN